jgi:hypothetical protein
MTKLAKKVECLWLIQQHVSQVYGAIGVQLHAFLTLLLDGGNWSASHFSPPPYRWKETLEFIAE